VSFSRYLPGPPLNQYIAWFWYYDQWRVAHEREHVLPDGSFELIFNLEDRSRKLFDREDLNRYQAFRKSWLSGAQSGYLIIDALNGASMMGVHFNPGGIAPFLKPSADELRNRVAELDGIWGSSAGALRERLLNAPNPQLKFRELEQFLLALLTRARSDSQKEKRVNWALKQFADQRNVQRLAGVAAQLGVSQKHFIHEFRQRVGITPKMFCRIRRFQSVLSEINRKGSVEWTSVALDCGYFDQAHFINDFQTFAGLNPTAYLSYRSDYPNFARRPE
jgi:AraC-like DNA-binding protein